MCGEDDRQRACSRHQMHRTCVALWWSALGRAVKVFSDIAVPLGPASVDTPDSSAEDVSADDDPAEPERGVSHDRKGTCRECVYQSSTYPRLSWKCDRRRADRVVVLQMRLLTVVCCSPSREESMQPGHIYRCSGVTRWRLRATVFGHRAPLSFSLWCAQFLQVHVRVFFRDLKSTNHDLLIG